MTRMNNWSRLLPLLFSFLVCGHSITSAGQQNTQSADTSSRYSAKWAAEKLGAPLVRDPIFVYNDWSAYDELSDNIPLTEQLAMRELDEILRLRRFGVRIDYYMMDAFWFAPDGGYRAWRKPNWPNGPDAWIKKCRDNGIMPGLWFGTNELVKINAIPEWQTSLTAKKGEMSFSEGGFLPNFMDAMQYWYDRGIRMFKFDFVDFGAATPETAKTKTPEEIRSRNVDAFREALSKFRKRNPDVVLVAFNGFGGDVESTAGTFPFHSPVDLRWLEVFDSLYSGDPRPSDVPEINFWRSMDIYSDHMVRRYEQSFLPLERIDSTGFMLGNTGTIYYRRDHAWKGALILMMARGGWVNTVHGNLEFLSDDDARWFAKVQSLYLRLQSMGRTKTFGGIPGEVQPYGFGSLDARGEVYAVVNPAQSVEEIQMPRLSREQNAVKLEGHVYQVEYFEAVGTATAGFGVVSVEASIGPETKALAAKADVAIVCVGFSPQLETEGADRTFALPGGQDELIRQVASVNKNTIVVITAGGNVDMTQWIDNIPVILHTWYPGQEGGRALAQVLFGDYSPSGKLPASFERRWEDNATFRSYYPEDHKKLVKYSEGIFVGYRHFDRSSVKPLFPFGYGLSYTTFAYSKLLVTPRNGNLDDPITVSFDLKNTGRLPGAEIAQLYVGDAHASLPRPVKELKGFAKVRLKPGEAKRVSLTLDRRAFSYYDVNKKDWNAEAGDFAILIGSSSDKIELKGLFTLSP